MTGEVDDLKQSEEFVEKLKSESMFLKETVWKLINHAEIYIVIIDSELVVRLMNWNLAKDLGFENEKEAVGRSWKEFIHEDVANKLLSIIKANEYNASSPKFREVISDLIRPLKEPITVKWFNTHINSRYNMTFSVGLKLNQMTYETTLSESEESIRNYYKDIIQKDRSMVKSLKDIMSDKC